MEHVAKFKGVLDLLGIPADRGEMVTNSYYLPRTRAYAKMNHIRIYDGRDLARMERYQRKRDTLIERLIPEPIEEALYFGRKIANAMRTIGGAL